MTKEADIGVIRHLETTGVALVAKNQNRRLRIIAAIPQDSVLAMVRIETAVIEDNN